MSAALGLLRLQQVDSRIDQLDDKLGRIRAALEDNLELVAARQALELATTRQEDIERNRLQAEIQATAQRRKLQQTESTLYGGGVHNPKELQDLQADVASLKKHLATLEAVELAWMEKLETVEEEFQAARARLEGIQKSANATHSQLVREQSELTASRNDLNAEREAARSAVAARLLEAYENLRRVRRGIAVAEIGDNACGACGTVLTAALQQSARHAAELVFCPSCGRILYGD